MSKMKAEATEGLVRLNKLTPDDVRMNYVTGIDADKMGGLELARSWEQLTTALLSVLYEVNNKAFMTRLYDAKIVDTEFEVAPQEYVVWSKEEPVFPIKVLGTPYYLYYSFSYRTVPFKIRELITLLKVNPKNVVLSITPYSYVDQDSFSFKLDSVMQIKEIRLAETPHVSFNNNKMVAVGIMNLRTKCNTFIGLIAEILGFCCKLSPDWFNRAAKYNKDTVLKVVKTKEEATLYDVVPREIPESGGCYITERMNADDIMAYLRDICKEFSISLNDIKLYCRDLDISKIKTGVYY